MKQEITFKTPEEAIAHARWYNPKVEQVIEPSIKSGEIKNRQELRFYMEFAGIQGYPVTCIANLYNLPE